jgi:Ser/Thr protein kinase RdoA (MazF antagonist)
MILTAGAHASRLVGAARPGIQGAGSHCVSRSCRRRSSNVPVLSYVQLHRSLPDPDGPCYVHYDFRPGNVLIQRGRISGLIDFESTRGGSADYDFIKIKNEVWDASPETRVPFLAGYQSIRDLPDIEHTLPLYALHNAYGGIAWCVKRSKLDDPFFDENLTRLRDILHFY